MAQRGPPCKADEVLTDGKWAGMSRIEAACAIRRNGARNRHAWMAAGVDKTTFYRWLAADEAGFATAYARATAEGVDTLLIDARESREAAELLRICFMYHHSVPDDPDEAPADRPVDGDALRALLARVAREAPHLLADALEGNREPEPVGGLENK